MEQEERIKQLNLYFFRTLEEAAIKYPDIKILLDDYNKIKDQENSRWSKEFIEGYLSCMSDLIIIKKML